MKPAENIPIESTTIRGLLGRNWLAIVAATVLSLAVEVGVYIAGVAMQAGAAESTLLAIGAALVWLVIACPVLAAGGKTWLDALLRGGIVADALGVGLLALWTLGYASPPYLPQVTPLAALKIYCLYVAIAVAAVAAVRISASAAGRHAIAVACATVLMLALASPFWVNGLFKNADSRGRQKIVAAVVGFNPFYSASSAVVERTGIVWHQQHELYNITRIGEYESPGPIDWSTAVINYSVIAILLSVAAVARHRLSRTART